jgi:hypothetical protein
MSQVTLFDGAGVAVAYVDYEDEATIYSFAGEPLAYLHEDHVYGFNGQHLGWFEQGVLRDHAGLSAGFFKDKSPVFTQFEPFKGFKQFKPFRGFQEFAPFKPFFSAAVIPGSLHDWLARGRA